MKRKPRYDDLVYELTEEMHEKIQRIIRESCIDIQDVQEVQAPQEVQEVQALKEDQNPQEAQGLQEVQEVQEPKNSQGIQVGHWLDGLHLSRKMMKGYVQDKLLFLNEEVTKPQHMCNIGDVLRIGLRKEKIDAVPKEIDFAILYEDEDILVIDKPRGITVNSANQVSLANGVAHYFKRNNIYRKVRFLNRLDRDTSGCIVIAKHGIAQSIYQEQMHNNTFEKWYETTVEGQMIEPVGTIEVPMGISEDGIHREVREDGKMTVTQYKVVAYDPQNNTSVVEVRLMTGKTHQIRVAMAHIGHPLVNDPLYGTRKKDEDVYKRADEGVHSEDIYSDKYPKWVKEEETFYLRAKKIVFTHMRTGERILVTC